MLAGAERRTAARLEPGGGDLQQTLVRALRMRAIGWYRERVADHVPATRCHAPKGGVDCGAHPLGQLQQPYGYPAALAASPLRPELIDYICRSRGRALARRIIPAILGRRRIALPAVACRTRTLRTESAGLPRIEAQDGYRQSRCRRTEAEDSSHHAEGR